jgi:hypothetical protein
VRNKEKKHDNTDVLIEKIIKNAFLKLNDWKCCINMQ